MKTFIKIAVFILALCQICGCFFACKKDVEDEVAEAPFDLTKEQLAEYKIVVPFEEQSEMNTAAQKLQKIIETAVGVKLEIKTDRLVEGSADFCETEYEILVGYTNRTQTGDTYADVRENDYGYALVGKKLLILGHSGETAEKAVMQFKLNALDKAESSVILKADAINVMTGSYDYDSFTLNGVSIGEYTIVYPNGGVKGEADIAYLLRDWIKDTTGYVLNCADDTSAVEYSIQIGDTAHITDAMKSQRTESGYASGKSYLGADGKKVWLSGNNRTVLYTAFSQFAKSAQAADKNLSIEIKQSGCLEFKGEFSISVMNYNVYYDLSEPKRNPDDVLVSVKQKSPDIFGLNEAGRNWINKFKADSEISSVYACAEGKALEDASDSSYNPIFYRKDKFELVENDTKWLSKTPDILSKDQDAKHYKGLTYVILKDKATGTEFMYVNTHLDGSNESDAHAALKELRKRQAVILRDFTDKYPFLPIIIGGDFNEGPSSAVIAGMSKDTRFKYCMNVADKKIDMNSTDVNSNYDSKSDGVIFDYIFVSADCISVQKYEQFDNKINGKYPADHLPVYAEITIKY